MTPSEAIRVVFFTLKQLFIPRPSHMFCDLLSCSKTDLEHFRYCVRCHVIKCKDCITSSKATKSDQTDQPKTEKGRLLKNLFMLLKQPPWREKTETIANPVRYESFMKEDLIALTNEVDDSALLYNN